MNMEEEYMENPEEGQELPEEEMQEAQEESEEETEDSTAETEEAPKGKKGLFSRMFGNSDEEGNKKIAEMEAELEKQTNLAKEYYNQMLLGKAEFENYRKRIERERPGLIQYGKAELLSKMLPMYDIMLAAGRHLETVNAPGLENTVKGMKMIFKEFDKIFESEGVRPMETVGKPYDPMATEILGIVDGTDENDGLVVEELQKGFYLGEKILRPARVKIARKKPEPKPQPEEKKNEEKEEAPEGEEKITN